MRNLLATHRWVWWWIGFTTWTVVSAAGPGADAAGAAAPGGVAADLPAQAPTPSARPVIYDPQADGQGLLDAALGRARESGRRVLVVVGANWCKWCHRLHGLMREDPAVAAVLGQAYEVVHLDADRGRNPRVLEALGHPESQGLPCLVVLNPVGGVLKVQESGILEAGDRHDPAKVLAFLREWAPPGLLPSARGAVRFDLISLFVGDLPRMAAFYRDVLGLPTRWDGQGPYAEFEHAGIRFAMYERARLPELLGRAPGFPNGLNGTFSLSLDLPFFRDVDAEYERLLKAGATPVYAPRDEPWGMRSSMVADPEGNLLEVGSWNRGR